MGGMGSGPQSGSRYRTTGASYGLDLASLRAAGYLTPARKASGAWQWWTDDDPTPTCTVGVEFDLCDPEYLSYRIHYTSTTVATGERQDIDIRGQLLTTQPPYGGTRYWFRCASCWWRRRVLYLPMGSASRRFACRRCHQLRYYSQTESEADRLVRRARKCWRRAGSTDRTEPWQKPKWMRWATFSRLVLEGREAQERGDMIAMAGLGAGLARIMNSRSHKRWEARRK
jgi:hypothetical protein